MKNKELTVAAAVVCSIAMVLCTGCSADNTSAGTDSDTNVNSDVQTENVTEQSGAATLTAYPDGFVADTNGKTLEKMEFDVLNELLSSNMGYSFSDSVIDSYRPFQYQTNNSDYYSYAMLFSENISYPEAKTMAFDYLFNMSGVIEACLECSFEDICDNYYTFEEYDNGFTLYFDADVTSNPGVYSDPVHVHYYGAYVYADGNLFAILADGTLAVADEERQEVLDNVDALFDLVGYTRPSEVLAGSTCCNVVNNDNANPYLKMIMPEITPESLNAALKQNLGMELTFTENYRDFDYSEDGLSISYSYYNMPESQFSNSAFYLQAEDYIPSMRSYYGNVYANAYENGVIVLSSNDDAIYFYYDCHDYTFTVTAHDANVDKVKAACAMLGLPVVEDFQQNSLFNCGN